MLFRTCVRMLTVLTMLTMIYLIENTTSPLFVRSAGVTRGADVRLVEIVALGQERPAVVLGHGRTSVTPCSTKLPQCGAIRQGPDAAQRLSKRSLSSASGVRKIAEESNTVRIGTQGTQTDTYVAGIFGNKTTKDCEVVAESTGHVECVTSSARYKRIYDDQRFASNPMQRREAPLAHSWFPLNLRLRTSSAMVIGDR